MPGLNAIQATLPVSDHPMMEDALQYYICMLLVYQYYKDKVNYNIYTKRIVVDIEIPQLLPNSILSSVYQYTRFPTPQIVQKLSSLNPCRHF